MWAIEHSGVRPDVLISAKGLANGFPLSMILSRKELMDRQAPGSMGGTYAGNAVSCAAASAVLDAFEREHILANTNARGKQLTAFLTQLQRSGSPAGRAIQQVRGHGLMIGVQFSHTQGSQAEAEAEAEPSAASHNTAALAAFEVDAPTRKLLAPQVSAECLRRGMLLLSTSTQDVIRFIPPLTISEEEMQHACHIFRDALDAVVAASQQ